MQVNTRYVNSTRGRLRVNMCSNDVTQTQQQPSIWICSEALARSGPSDSCMPACFQIRSVWPKPDTVSQNQIRSWLVLHNMTLHDHLWKNTTKSERWKLVAGWLHSARTMPNDSCSLAYFWTRCFPQKPNQAIHIRSMPVLHNNYDLGLS